MIEAEARICLFQGEIKMSAGFSSLFDLQGHNSLIADFDNLEITQEELIQKNKRDQLCHVRNKFGRRTPLHNSAIKGRVDVVKLLLEGCPDLIREISATGETCLHTAVRYNKAKVIQFLVHWVSQRTQDYAHHLINTKDCSGNTILHLATSRKQLQTLKVLLTNDPTIRNLVDVNAINSGRFTALDILDVLPYSGKIDMEINRILRGAGALRARDFANHDASNHPVHDCTNIIKCTSRLRRQIAYCILLVTATILAAITYLAAFSAPAGTFKDSYIHYRYETYNGNLQLRKSDSIITRWFVMFNSTGFIASVAMIIFLLHEFPLKPWPQISILAMFGSYMCLIKAISPDEALALLLLAIPFLLLAAAGKMYGFARQSLSLCS